VEPLLVTVTVNAEVWPVVMLPKLKVGDDTVKFAAVAATQDVVPVALSPELPRAVSVAVNVPATSGVHVVTTEQLCPAARVVHADLFTVIVG
jgi:hypothetical protein